MLVSSAMEVGVATLVTLDARVIPAVRRAQTVALGEDAVLRRKSNLSSFPCRGQLIIRATEIIVLSQTGKKVVAQSDRLALVLPLDVRFQDTIHVQELAIAVVRLQSPHTYLSRALMIFCSDWRHLYHQQQRCTELLGS